jgi:16S rRNA C1402 (ribose-2'-O) methylase RsmI
MQPMMFSNVVLPEPEGPIIATADMFTGLGISALVYLPKIPLTPADPGSSGILCFTTSGLGLGDFFFTGVLAIQTFKRFDTKYAYAATAQWFCLLESGTHFYQRLEQSLALADSQRLYVS